MEGTTPFSPMLDTASIQFLLRQPNLQYGSDACNELYEEINTQQIVDSVVFILRQTQNKKGYAPPYKVITKDALKKAFVFYHPNSTRFNKAHADEQQVMSRQFQLLKIFQLVLDYEPSPNDENELLWLLKEQVTHKMAAHVYRCRAHLYELYESTLAKEAVAAV